MQSFCCYLNSYELCNFSIMMAAKLSPMYGEVTSHRYVGHTGRSGYAQENPDLDEQPDKAPLGIEGLPDPIWKWLAEMVLVTSRLLHLGHFTISETCAEVVNTSK